MNITKNDIVGELVAKDYRLAAIFKSEGIDFCCRGNRSVQEVSEESKLNIDELIERLEESRKEAKEVRDYNAWPIDLLADYIEKKHHRYVEEKISEIKPYLEKVVKVHGDQHPELKRIKMLFEDSAGELAMHMKKEELVLFPFVQKLMKYKDSDATIETPRFGTLGNPIAMMKEEHDNEGIRFRQIAELSSNYTPPQDACNTYKVTYALLKEFEADLHLHIHLENNILFPKALKMERELKH